MKALLAAFLASTVAICGSVQASVIMTFDDIPASSWNFGNLSYQGFRISPNNYYDIREANPNPTFQAIRPYDSQWLGWSSGSGAVDRPPRCSAPFLGPSCGGPASVYFDYRGDIFSLLALDNLSLYGSSVTWLVSTSASPTPRSIRWEYLEHVVFSDPMWSNITWAMFGSVNDGDVLRGFDNMQFDVPRQLPEPGTALLVGLGLSFLAISRRKRRLQ